MKKLTLPRLRSLAPQPKKKVQKLAANAAHRLTPPAYEDYDEEPTTKLSTAFLVVLVLHLVAVGGIYAFHSIKSHRRQADPTPSAAEVAKGTAAPKAAAPTTPATPPIAAPSAALAAKAPAAPGLVASPAKAPAAPVSPAVNTPASTVQTPAQKPPAKTEPAPVLPQGKGANPAAASGIAANASGGAHPEVHAAGKTYTVAKGDNPVLIAKRLGVGYDELLKVNGIEDPKKLQIGQVLKVPAKKGAN
ncbi:MAG: LysM domain [Verrucomicrobiota bacterium]|jgi:LysM repeat protein